MQPALAGWQIHTQLDQLYDQLGHAGWPAHTQLDQPYDQLDQLNFQAGQAGKAGFYSRACFESLGQSHSLSML